MDGRGNRIDFAWFEVVEFLIDFVQ